MEKHLILFRDNFSLVGNDKGGALIYDGPADYLFYLSGRRNCQYIHERIMVCNINPYFYQSIFMNLPLTMS